MQADTPSLLKIPLFSGISAAELPSLLNCLGVKQKSFAKNEYVFVAGQKVRRVGIVLRGRIQIVKDDLMGNRTILAECGAWELFAESFACARVVHAPVSALAAEPAEIMFIDCQRIISVCSSSCRFHNKLVENLLKIVADKNLMLNRKIEVISQRSIREKLLAYLNAEAQKQNARSFRINFSRQELADYLCADRSALSRELSKLQAEGLVSCNGRNFEMLSL